MPEQRVGREVRNAADDLKYWPKCAQCGKPVDAYEMARDDQTLVYEIRMHHHSKVHTIRKPQCELIWMAEPLEAFTPGWDK